MKPPGPVTKRSICLVLERYAEWLQEQDSECRAEHATSLTAYLDSIANEDGFSATRGGNRDDARRK